jgi:hypothetical protein
MPATSAETATGAASAARTIRRDRRARLPGQAASSPARQTSAAITTQRTLLTTACPIAGSRSTAP